MRSAPSFALCTELSELCIEDVDGLPEDAIVVISALRLKRLTLNIRSMQQALDAAASKPIKLNLPHLQVADLSIRCSDLYRLFALCSTDGLSSLTTLYLHGHGGGIANPIQVIDNHIMQQGVQALVATFRNMLALPNFTPSHLLDIDTQINAVDLSLMSISRYILPERRAKLSIDSTHSHPNNIDMHASVMEGILSAISPLHVAKRLHVGLRSLSPHPFQRDPISALSGMGALTTLRLSGDVGGVRDMLEVLAQSREEPVSLRIHMILDGFALKRATLAHLHRLASRSGNRIKLTIIGHAEEAWKAALAGQHCLVVEYEDA
ncbi:unnamed protein product [Peniophora sp. CBMAI 1063]|nr:unnamed protein product [Peniophora sp. CBMAI 1063]